MNLVAEFSYNDSYIRIGDFKYKSHCQYANTFFDIEVKTGSFSGVVTFESTIENFKGFVEDISLMYDFKKEKVFLADSGYGSYVEMKIDKLGHIECLCQVYSEFRDNELKLRFSADQTALGKFLSQLNSFIKYF